MLKRFFPKQPNFFKILSELAVIATQAIELFERAVQKPQEMEAVVRKISDLEAKADTLVREGVDTLTKTFITPIEREHLHRLFLLSDEIIDLIYATSERMMMYRLTELTARSVKMISLTDQCVKQFRDMVENLDNMKTPTQLHKTILAIKKTENEIDREMRMGMAELYDSDLGIGRILKERDFILVLERVSDEIERSSQLIESILIDQA